MFNFKKSEVKLKMNIIIGVIALVFGILGGLVSSVYLWPNILSSRNISNNEIDLSSPEYNKANLVIQYPKKVYINQDLQIEESTNYLQEAIVGVFPKNKNTMAGNYIMTDELSSGLIISSDGWVLLNVLNDKKFDKNIIKNKDSYSIISKKEKKVYEIDDVYDFSDQGLVFLKIKSDKYFTTRNFVNISDLRIGQTLMTYSFSSEVGINYLQKISSGDNIKFSDNYKNFIILNTSLTENFANSFIFNLSGDLLALIDGNLDIRPIHDFRSDIFTFLKNKELNKINWGLYYIDLEDVASSTFPQYGAWVYNNGLEAVTKNSVAAKSGIKTGDIITKINKYEINNFNSFNDVLNNFIVGDNISVFILRDGQTQELELKL
jgi:S1-C subfamily serine protease